MNAVRLLLGADIRSVRNQVVRGLRPAGLWRGASAALIVATFWVGTYFFFSFIFDYLEGLPVFGPILATRLLGTVFLIFLFLILFSDIVTALSVFYSSKDVEFLIAKPVEMVHIFGQKFAWVFVYGSWVVLCFGLPMFIAYGQSNKAGLPFHLLSPLLVLPFLVIPAGVGVAATMLLARFLPPRRTRFLLIAFVAFFGGATFGLFRIIRPELLTSPDQMATVGQYLYRLQLADSAYLPSSWVTASFRAVINQRPSDCAFFWSLLVTTAGVTLIAGAWLVPRIFHKGWDRAQSTSSAGRRRAGEGKAELVPGARALIMKDIRVFLRDAAQWAQMVFLISLVVVYLLNSRRLPVNLEEAFWRNLLAFVNLGLTAYIMATIALKFVFPAVSLEGKSFWIVASSPISIRRFIAAKFWGSLLLLLTPAEAVMFLSGLVLKVGETMQMLAAATILVLTFGLTAMAVGMGAIFPRFDLDNAAEISSGLGGLINIVFALLYVGSMIVLVAWPFHAYVVRGFSEQFYGRPILIASTAFIIINALAIWLPLALASRSLRLRDSLP